MKPAFFPVLICFSVLAACLTMVPGAGATDTNGPVLTRAVMCEDIESFKPVRPAVLFSISQGEVFCFTDFGQVTRKTDVFHRWYKRDKLIFTMKLVLTPPKWSSVSRIQLRDADKGPWRVEVQDKNGNLLKTLRFSISD